MLIRKGGRWALWCGFIRDVLPPRRLMLVADVAIISLMMTLDETLHYFDQEFHSPRLSYSLYIGNAQQ